MAIERKQLIKRLLGQYNNVFNKREVRALKKGIPLSSDASPTLLDIEQSLLPSVPAGQSLDSLRPSLEGSDTIE